jgi:hypothetical protein
MSQLELPDNDVGAKAEPIDLSSSKAATTGSSYAAYMDQGLLRTWGGV